MSKTSNMQRLACLKDYIKELHKTSRYGWGKRRKPQQNEQFAIKNMVTEEELLVNYGVKSRKNK
jgi:hypothetical protein